MQQEKNHATKQCPYYLQATNGPRKKSEKSTRWKNQNVLQQFSFCARLVSISNRADVDKFATLTFCSLLTLVRTCALTNNLIQPGSARDQFYTNCQLFLCTFRQSIFVPYSLSYLHTVHVYFFLKMTQMNNGIPALFFRWAHFLPL